MRLSAKLVTSFTVIIVLNIILGGIIYANVNNTATNLDEIAENAAPATESVGELRTGFSGLMVAQEILQEEVESFRYIVDEPEKFAEKMESLSAFSDDQLAAYLQDRLTPMFNALNENAIAMNEADNTLGSVVELVDENIVQLSDETETMAEESRVTMIVFNGIAAFIAIILALFLSGLIATPMRQLTTAANEIGEGNVDAEIPEIKSKDEVKDLADALETIRGAIKFLKKQ